MKSQKITFENQDGITLSARIELPLENQPLAFVIFAHCFTCNKDLTAVRNISRALSSEGLGVFLFDFTGLGESEGDFSETDFSSNISDLLSASEWLRKNYDVDQFMIGHSLGGAAVLATAGMIDEVKAAVTIGSPYDPFHVSNLFKEHIDEIKAKGKAEVHIGGRPFQLSKQFIEDLKTHDPKDTISGLRKPLMVMHSPQDEIVSIKNAAKIYIAAMHPKNFLSLDGADHLMSRRSDSSYAGQMIAHWIKSQLEVKPKKAKSSDEDLEEGFVRAITSNQSFTTPIKTGNHHILADEPTSVGGSDLGPSPYNLLAAALASCTSMTIQMYAKRKKWDLQEATVEIKHEKKHKLDCEDGAKIDHFTKRIRLEGNLDDSQRQRLLEMASKCPVHRTLENDVHIDSELMD